MGVLLGERRQEVRRAHGGRRRGGVRRPESDKGAPEALRAAASAAAKNELHVITLEAAIEDELTGPKEGLVIASHSLAFS